MPQQITKHFGFLKTTALGGLIFLLPLIVIGALLGQVGQIVVAIARELGEWIPYRSVGGISLLILLAIGILVLACFFAGLAARRAFAKRISQFVEKNLMLVFPRYAIFKYQLAGSIGDAETKSQLKPVLVRFDDVSRIALEVERNESGRVTIFLPGAPDPWSGTVAHTTVDRIEPLDIEFSEVLATFERLGRDSVALLSEKPADAPTT